MSAVKISPRFRTALAGKGLLLLSLALVFAALLQRGVLEGDRHVLLRLIALVLFGAPLLFLGWFSMLAFADALIGQAVEVSGAVALAPKRRRWGVSFRLPDGRAAEFILFNQWEPLEAHATYTVVVGRWSRVLVEAPRPG